MVIILRRSSLEGLRSCSYRYFVLVKSVWLKLKVRATSKIWTYLTLTRTQNCLLNVWHPFIVYILRKLVSSQVIQFVRGGSTVHSRPLVDSGAERRYHMNDWTNWMHESTITKFMFRIPFKSPITGTRSLQKANIKPGESIQIPLLFNCTRQQFQLCWRCKV